MTSTYGAGANRQLKNNALSKVKLVLRHQFPGIELVSPIYAGNGITCSSGQDLGIKVLHRPGDDYFIYVRRSSYNHRIDFGSTVQVDLNIGFSERNPRGILAYELERKKAKQLNEYAIYNEDEETCIWLVMVLEFVNEDEDFFVASDLMECDQLYFWSWFNLMGLAGCYKNGRSARESLSTYFTYSLKENYFPLPIENTYLMYDNRVLMTRYNLAREKTCYRFEVTISETSIKNDTWRLGHVYTRHY
jgi:hypothetical protein